MNKRIMVLALALAVLALCLVACAQEPEVDDASMLELPGIKWGATPEEVKEALNITDEMIVAEQERGESGWILLVTDVSLFGENVAYAHFSFSKYPWNEDFAFDVAELYYPDETDMAAIEDVLTELYGESKDGMNWWESTAKLADALPADVQEAMLESGIIDYSGANRIDTTNPSELEAAREYLQQNPAVSLYCTDNAKISNKTTPQYRTKNEVHYDANEYMWALLYHSK